MTFGALVWRAWKNLKTFWNNDVACPHLLTTIILAGFAGQLFVGKQFRSPGYAWFVKTWPHNQISWATVLMAAAVTSFSAFFVWPRRPHQTLSYADAWHIFCAGVLVAGHLVIAEGYFLNNWHSTGTITYSVAALFGMRVMSRIYGGDRIWPARSYGALARTASRDGSPGALGRSPF